MSVGIIIILVLVVLIILICVGYCVYKKFCQKPEPRDQTRQDSKTGKGEYHPAPANDPENPA
jgi:flagellar basal body-associated protein FliL